MADNYFNATGVLVLDRVTPVISALFGGFSLDATYPGDGEAYIAQMADTSDPLWETVCANLFKLAAELGLAIPEADDPPMVNIICVLADHFGVGDDADLSNLIEHHDFDGWADLDVLFLIATCFDDGHHLSAVIFEGCWSCSKPRLFEFGGNSCFISKEVSLYGSSSQVPNLGRKLYPSVKEDDLGAVADLIAREASYTIDGIENPTIRETVRQLVIERLTRRRASESAG